MRRLVIVVLLALLAGLPAVAHAQAPAPAPGSETSDFGLHPLIGVVAGAMSGVVIASAVAGSLITGALLAEGFPLAEALETGTGLTVAAVAASAVFGSVMGYLLFSR